MCACMYVCVIPKALCIRCSHSADAVPRPLHLADLKTACFFMMLIVFLFRKKFVKIIPIVAAPIVPKYMGVSQN